MEGMKNFIRKSQCKPGFHIQPAAGNFRNVSCYRIHCSDKIALRCHRCRCSLLQSTDNSEITSASVPQEFIYLYAHRIALQQLFTHNSTDRPTTYLGDYQTKQKFLMQKMKLEKNFWTTQNQTTYSNALYQLCHPNGFEYNFQKITSTHSFNPTANSLRAQVCLPFKPFHSATVLYWDNCKFSFHFTNNHHPVLLLFPQYPELFQSSRPTFNFAFFCCCCCLKHQKSCFLHHCNNSRNASISLRIVMLPDA